jgi:hypothetical protein
VLKGGSGGPQDFARGARGLQRGTAGRGGP